MTAKLSGPRKASFLLLSLSIILSGAVLCRAGTVKDTIETAPVPLDKFWVGVKRQARRRYVIKDIRVGDVPVRDLFNLQPRPGATRWPGGYLWLDDIWLIIAGGNQFAELRQILIAHPNHSLEVVLQDTWNPLNSEKPYEYSILIPVTFEETGCEIVTRLIYEKLISDQIKDVHEQDIQKRQANRRLDIDDVFAKLHDGKQIETFIKSLDSITPKPCVETIELLKSQTDGKVTRFASGQYTLENQIRDGLTLIIKAMETSRDWWKSDVSVRVIGYTDEVEVTIKKDKELKIDQAKISADAWRRINYRFDVSYGGCKKDKLDEKDQYVYVGFPGNSGEQKVGSPIQNNCELGAVRAYVAMVYLTNELHRTGPEDSYATGGIYYGTDVTGKDDEKRRRVHVELILRAAKVDNSTP